MKNISMEDEVAQVRMKRPHVVLLGAGASRAACPQGDRAGRHLPLMADLVDTLALGDLIPERLRELDFEAAYSALVAEQGQTTSTRAIEQRIIEYFSKLELPESATIYDYLVLSLQPKDVIATFNWDPFLIQAVRRNADLLERSGGPQLLFLHGNVWEGYCHDDLTIGTFGTECSSCRRAFSSRRLLFPVTSKDYSADVFLKDSWKQVSNAFRAAFMVTVFGYSAPESDRDAVAMLKEAWGKWETREMEQFEIIDVRGDDELLQAWKPFIHSHHYSIRRSFFESSLTLHPRRTGEDFLSRLVEANWTTPNRPPRGCSLAELRAWHRPLVEAEQVAVEGAR